MARQTPIELLSAGILVWLGFSVIAAADDGGGAALLSEVRIIAGRSAAGNCTGDSITPICAVEAFIGCWVGTPSFDCGNRPYSARQDMVAWESLGYADRAEYSIVSEHRFTAEDLERKRPRAHRYPMGTVEIVLKQRLSPDRSGSPEWRTGYYILAREAGEWSVLSYSFAPWPDPRNARRRWMSQREASSDCIGDSRDAVCAAETLVACWLRRDGNLCRKIVDCQEDRYAAALCGLPDNRMSRIDATLRWPQYSLEYYVIKAVPSERTGFGPPGAPLMEIWIEQYYLGPAGNEYRLVPEFELPGLHTAPGPAFWVAQIDGRWSVVSWGGELDN